MHSASPEDGNDANNGKSDHREGRTSTEDIVQSFDAPVSVKTGARENKRKASVYALSVSFDSKGSANRKINSKLDEESTQKENNVGENSDCNKNDHRLVLCILYKFFFYLHDLKVRY